MRPRIESRKAAGNQQGPCCTHHPLGVCLKKDRKPCADFVSCFRSAVRVIRIGRSSQSIHPYEPTGRHLAGQFSLSSAATMYGMLLESVQHFIQVGQATDFFKN
jgi:hypothetical protein